MSRTLYKTSMEILEKSLGLPEYKGILLELEKIFFDTHITISDIDSYRDNLYKYYYEKTLITKIESHNNKNILDLIYEDGNIDKLSYDFLSNKKLSIFQVKKVKKDSLVISDIFTKSPDITIFLNDDWIAIEKGELIQSFLYESNEPYLSTNGFIHPKEVKKLILKEAKSIIKNNNDDIYIGDLLSKLFRRFVNSMRYSKKNPLEIYTIDL